MKTIPIEEWRAVMEAQLARLPAATNLVLEGLGVRFEESAKGYIGEYQEGWEELAESTLEQKTALGYAPPDNPLLREGTMRESISHAVIGDMASGGAAVVVGSPSKIALYQEMGTENIPPRPFLSKAVIDNLPVAAEELGLMVVDVLGKVP